MKQYNNYADLITFTRASSGTALRPISYGDELVVNGDFSTDSDWEKQTGWSISGGKAVADGSGTFQYLRQVMQNKFTVGSIYRITFDVVLNSGICRLFAQNVAYSNITTSGTYSYDVVAIASSDSPRIDSRSPAFDGTIDNFSIREVLFDQPDGTLTLFNHSTNIPRIEYDSDGNRLGLLVEEARTNLVTYSEDFSNASWSGNKTTHTADQIGPDGVTNSAYTLTDTSSTSIAGLAQSFSCSNDTAPRTFSVFLKKTISAASFSGIQISYSGGTSIFSGLTVNTDTGTVVPRTGGGLTAPDSFTIEDFGTYWRASITASNNGTGNTSVFVNIYPSVNSDGGGAWDEATLVGSCVAYGAQFEAGSFPTSYIPSNSGSTTTRSADVASIGVSEFGYNQSQTGTFLLSWVAPDGYNGRPLSITASAGTGDRFTDIIGISTSRVDLYSNHTGGDLYSLNPYTDGVENKIAFTMGENDAAACLNGGTVDTDTATGTPPASNYVNFGVWSGSYLNGHIKSIKYYPRRLTNSQLVEITS